MRRPGFDPDRVRDFNLCPGTGCVSLVFCLGLSLAVAVIFCWPQIQVVAVDLGFTTLLTSQVISVAFYSEREKSHKFCSEALISAWGSFTCRKSTTWNPWLYFPSEGSHTQDFDPGRVWTMNLDRFRKTRPCISVQCSDPKSVAPYRYFIHGYLACKSLGIYVLHWWRINNK